MRKARDAVLRMAFRSSARVLCLAPAALVDSPAFAISRDQLWHFRPGHAPDKRVPGACIRAEAIEADVAGLMEER